MKPMSFCPQKEANEGWGCSAGLLPAYVNLSLVSLCGRRVMDSLGSKEALEIIQVYCFKIYF